MIEWMNERTNERTNEQANERTNGLKTKQKYPEHSRWTEEVNYM